MCASGDMFVDDAEYTAILAEMWGAVCVDMEAAAIAAVMRDVGLLDRFVAIKGISDGGDSDARDDHEKNLIHAMERSIQIVKEIIA